jgi:pimeloyl-ACP methyl ester carboxylesterase
MAPVARELANTFRVLEPFQRRSGGAPLTVARHVADLAAFIATRCGDTPPLLVGHSWGAMLALAIAATHPGAARALALVACGTFDEASRRQLQTTLDRRVDSSLRWRLARLAREVPDADERLRVLGDLLLPVYSYDLLSIDLEVAACDVRAFEETWDDMIRLQRSGLYPAAFDTVRMPVLMLHGADDPHPGAMTRDTLRAHIPHLEYVEWSRCGHYPWLERSVRDEFFRVLRAWLVSQARAPGELEALRSGTST